jgi:plasmid segregation protein ParM
MIVGVDVGYSHTKVYSSRGADIFLSTFEEGTNDVNKKAIKIEFEGKEYTIASPTGAFSTDLNKINDLNFRLCLYTAIARQMKSDTVAEIQLVTGLPAEYYKSQKQELINSLEGLKVNIILNGQPKRFTITNCLVFPQSAGLFILNPGKFEGDNIVIDIGGLTVDVSLFDDMTLTRTGTYELGMLKLYDKIIQTVKAEYEVSYDVLKAEQIIKTKQIIDNGEVIDVTDLVNRVLRNHTDSIIMNVKNGFKEYDTSRRNFIGGGSYMLRDYLPGIINSEDIYTNAKAFYMVGVDRFEN